MRRRTLYNNNTYAGILSNEAVAGDICLYNKQQDRLELYSQNVFDDNTFPLSKYTPVGVVVIPGSHNVYGDGSCSVISTKYMNYNTPDVGSTNLDTPNGNIMYYGNHDTLPKLTNVPTISSGNTLSGTSGSGSLPSNFYTGTQCPHDTDTFYKNAPKIPSPYLSDESRNPTYYQISSPSTSLNTMSDFNGYENTQYITTLETTQPNWKTDEKIQSTPSHARTSYPAFYCCLRYHTEGTKQGDWYFPACGELGYVIPKLSEINSTLSKIKEIYGNEYSIAFYTEYNSTYGYSYHLTSTNYDEYECRAIVFNNGNVYHFSDWGDYEAALVRAFLRVKI